MNSKLEDDLLEIAYRDNIMTEEEKKKYKEYKTMYYTSYWILMVLAHIIMVFCVLGHTITTEGDDHWFMKLLIVLAYGVGTDSYRFFKTDKSYE